MAIRFLLKLQENLFLPKKETYFKEFLPFSFQAIARKSLFCTNNIIDFISLMLLEGTSAKGKINSNVLIVLHVAIAARDAQQ